jgi:cytochrome c-type biogenesis protein
LDELTGERHETIRKKVILSTLAYISGFSLVFILLGASASLMGGLLKSHQTTVRLIGGVLIIILGIHLTGIIRIKSLELDKRIQVKSKPVHLFGTFLIGMAFAGGWSPCVGPILAAILVLAGNQETVFQGTLLLAVYSMGLALPFIIISIFINFILVFIKKIKKVIPYVNAVAGVLLIIMGFLLISNKLRLLIWVN